MRDRIIVQFKSRCRVIIRVRMVYQVTIQVPQFKMHEVQSVKSGKLHETLTFMSSGSRRYSPFCADDSRYKL